MRGFMYEAYELLTEGYAIDQYENIPIYWDDVRGVVYIYTQEKGKGKILFPNTKEAIEYIKDNTDLIDQKYNYYTVVYITSSDSTSQTEVYAKNTAEARSKAKLKLGRECFKIIDVIERD